MSKHINLSNMSNNQKKKLTGFKEKEIASGVLIAQFGRNDNVLSREKLSRQIIWKIINEILFQINEHLPFRVTFLDCKKELINYYKKQGFIEVNFDEKNNLYLLYRKEKFV